VLLVALLARVHALELLVADDPFVHLFLQQPHFPVRSIQNESVTFFLHKIMKAKSAETFRVVFGVGLGGFLGVVADLLVGAVVGGPLALPLHLRSVSG
jgi:hypothetical protein